MSDEFVWPFVGIIITLIFVIIGYGIFSVQRDDNSPEQCAKVRYENEVAWQALLETARKRGKQ